MFQYQNFNHYLTTQLKLLLYRRECSTIILPRHSVWKVLTQNVVPPLSRQQSSQSWIDPCVKGRASMGVPDAGFVWCSWHYKGFSLRATLGDLCVHGDKELFTDSFWEIERDKRARRSTKDFMWINTWDYCKTTVNSVCTNKLMHFINKHWHTNTEKNQRDY